jgi:DNA-binding LytR/AlgR family response regulator
MLSILIVEDDANFRTRFAEIVASCSELELLAAVGSCAEARACLARASPDVLLCDLGLPDGDGADVVREARSDWYLLSEHCYLIDGKTIAPGARMDLPSGAVCLERRSGIGFQADVQFAIHH